MKTAICALSLVLAACGGQEPGEKAVRSASNDLVVNWAASGNETDPNAAFGAQFGSAVAANGNWIAVARQPATATDIGRVEVWQRSGTGWAHKFTWPGHVGHKEVVAMSPNWMFIGEPCIATSGCSGSVFGLVLFNGTTWTEEIQSININPPDFGSALAMNDDT
ncbi:MAG TPA: hypothetical protein VH083_18990, partial [Myxococcales bacterium]|nr:hypothetical protein [Myxococcales bacterium]